MRLSFLPSYFGQLSPFLMFSFFLTDVGDYFKSELLRPYYMHHLNFIELGEHFLDVVAIMFATLLTLSHILQTFVSISSFLRSTQPELSVVSRR